MREQRPIEIKPESDKSISSDNHIDDTVPKSGWKTLSKKVAGTMGKGVKKGVKKVADFKKKQNQKRKWKTAILSKLDIRQLKQLCSEQDVSTKKTIEKDGKYFGDVIEVEVNLSQAELISELRSEVSLNAIKSFANRNHINIKDILADMEEKKLEWEIKDYKEIISKNKKLPDDFYQSVAWGKVRKLVLKRNNYKCKHCGALANHVDHISSARIYPELALNLNNLISSCEKCHKERHGGKGFKN